jgi:hypothetical protein
MKKILFLAAVATLAVGAGSALARPASSHAVKTVTIVMHDPGCHWFSVGGKLQTSLTVKGPVKLFNIDEAALKVAGAKGVQLDKVGGRLLLAKGLYKITMVGQAPDDNHLKLVVR